jgi:hypothetical protein
VGVCEEYESMGVRSIVDLSTALSANGRQSEVERAKIGRAERLELLGVSSDAPTGTGLRVDFNAEDTEYTEKRKRNLCRTGDDHGE